ncbi:MAG: hypothetical protein M0R03_23830, partial [Novosphingobium sp.]|nr:hypothetical protein [Novosphingobium sp.]
MNDTKAALAAEWRKFVQTVDGFGQRILSLAGDDAIDQGEGLRYLTRFLRYAFFLQLESADPDFPRVFSASSETQKFIGDSPDYLYEMMAISDHRQYRIRGTRGAAPRLHFSTYSLTPAGVVCTGSVCTPDFHIGEDGTYEIIASITPVDGNWLPMAEGALFLQVRNFFESHHRKNPAQVTVEAIDGPAHPEPYDAARALAGLGKVIGQMERTIPLAIGFMDKVLERAGPNAF